MLFDKGQIIDLSRHMKAGMEPLLLETEEFKVWELFPSATHREGEWYVMGNMHMSTHAGTHIEFPGHKMENGLHGGNFPLENLIGEAVVLDFSHKKIDEAITVEELKVHEHRIRPGDMIFLRTDCDRNYYDKNLVDKFPYPTPDAMDWLLSFNPKVLGSDSWSLEVPDSVSKTEQPNHEKMFSKGVPMIELATNLAAVGEERVTVFILPLRIDYIDSCPVRMIAILDRK